VGDLRCDRDRLREDRQVVIGGELTVAPAKQEDVAHRDAAGDLHRVRPVGREQPVLLAQGVGCADLGTFLPFELRVAAHPALPLQRERPLVEHSGPDQVAVQRDRFLRRRRYLLEGLRRDDLVHTRRSRRPHENLPVFADAPDEHCPAGYRRPGSTTPAPAMAATAAVIVAMETFLNHE